MSEIKYFNSEFISDQIAAVALNQYMFDNNKKKECSKVVMVDVGAGKPEHYSNTTLFRKLGCKVICIEPNPRFAEMFRNVGMDILEYAVTKEDVGSIMFREYVDGLDGLGGSSVVGEVNNFPNAPCKEYEVKALSLNTILKTHHPEVEEIDVLDLDIEGNELDVIRGLDMDKYKPKVIIIENLDPENNGYHKFFDEIGYKLVACCAHNDILVRK